MRRFENLKMGLVILVLMAALGCSTKEQSAAGGDQYTCPMHPTVISDKQGACPVCGMDLVRKAREGEEVKITEDLARLLQSPDEAVVANVKTLRGEYRKMQMTVEAHGAVTYDTRHVQDINVRIGGRLEKVNIHYPFQRVRAGQTLAEIYSPEMLTAQNELLLVIANDPGNTALISMATKKLQLLGATTAQINDLMRTKETKVRFAITSPYDGYAFVPAVANGSEGTTVNQGGATSGMTDGGMPGGTSTSTAVTPSSRASMMHEGDYVSRGERLLSVVSLTAVRIELNLASRDAGVIRTGDSITLSMNEGGMMVGKVDFVQPYFDEGTEFQKIRVYIRDADLRIGQLVDATINRTSAETLWLPAAAIADLGADRVVFIKERGVFKPRKIKTGIRSDGWIEIVAGLASSDEVAAQASFLVDSESFVKAK